MKCYPCRQYYASIAFGLAKKKATIMRHFSIKLLTGPIQNGGQKGGVVLDSVYQSDVCIKSCEMGPLFSFIFGWGLPKFKWKILWFMRLQVACL